MLTTQLRYVIIIPDDFGFSVRCAITSATIGSKGFEHIGKFIGDPTINKTTRDTGLEHEEAELLALNVEKFFRTQRGEIKKGKRKK